VSSAIGDRSTGRRKKRRGDEALTPAQAGEMLREARERLGIDLAEVHDRTGISWRNLEALESGEVQRFSEPSAAAIAMRRYADLVSVESQPLIDSLQNAPTYAYSGAASKGSPVVGGARPGGGSRSEHLRQYGDDHTHLKAFTQTAEVPAVGGRPPGPSPEGWLGEPSRYYKRSRRRAPWLLRFFTWLVIFLIVVGAAGLSVDHYEPQWLRAIHILKSPARSGSSGSSGTHETKTTVPPPPTTASTSPAVEVTTTKSRSGTASVSVGTADYSIVISTFGACWIEAQTPLNVNPVINRTLLGGQSATIPVSGGQQISLELGSLSAEIKVQVGGQTVLGWSLKPDAVPFFATFTSR
jgi:cytoskeletal protein RodZ